jgi:hypothetical protein
VICGCEDEPPSYRAWGAAFAGAVEAVQGWAAAERSRQGYSDKVTVMAGDDAEPAFDPGYLNTYDLLAGYAATVGGYQPAMVDYGSAEPGYWTESQLLTVANGFRPDVAVPEIYYPSDARDWGALVSYAKSEGVAVRIYGVLADPVTGNSASFGSSSLLNVLQGITGQAGIAWQSELSR